MVKSSKKKKVGRGNPITAKEIEVIRNLYPQVSAAEIARRLNRSRACISARIKAMKETGELVYPDPEKPLIKKYGTRTEKGLENQERTRLNRLEELRDILYEQLLNSSPAQVARISVEYRAVIDEIEKEIGRGDEADDKLDELAASIFSSASASAPETTV